MANKLFVVWLSVTMVTFSSISIYASENTGGDFFIPKADLTSVEEAGIVKDSATGEKESRTKTAVNEKTAEEEKKIKEEKYIEGLSAYIISVNRNVSKGEALDMARNFVKYSDEYGVDEKVVMAMAQGESTFYSDVVSSEDFKGLMQTGDNLAINAGYDPQELFKPEVSIKVGTKYLKAKMEEFGDTLLALTAYNQGSGSVNSGNYSTGYAELVMDRADSIETFLIENGYKG